MIPGGGDGWECHDDPDAPQPAPVPWWRRLLDRLGGGR